MAYVKAEEGAKNSVIYFDEEGNKLVRYWKKYEDEPVDQASTRSWHSCSEHPFEGISQSRSTSFYSSRARWILESIEHSPGKRMLIFPDLQPSDRKALVALIVWRNIFAPARFLAFWDRRFVQ